MPHTKKSGLRASLLRGFYASVLALQGTPLYRRAAAFLHPSYAIAVATSEDILAVHQWLSPSGAYGDQPVARTNGVDYVAKHSSRVIGFVQYVHWDENIGPHAGDWLFSLFVRLSWRGVGVGEALCRRLLNDARAQGISDIRLIVDADNVPAVRLYHKLGFERQHLPALDALLAEKSTAGRVEIIMGRRL